ncbi:MAG: O-antigen ligase family protein [Gammaproteobacteria bacterium]
MNVDSSGLSSKQKLSIFEISGAGLIILAFALLPIGRTVEIPTALMAMGGLYLLIREGKGQGLYRPDVRAFSVLFLLYWLPMATSLFGAYDLNNSAFFCLKYLRFFFAGYFVLYLSRSNRIKTLVLSALSLVIGFWLLDSLYQWQMGTDLLGRSYQGGRLLGPFKHLIMPVFLSVFLPLVLIYTKLKWPRYLFWALFVASLWVLFLAGSRASWLALLFGGLLYLIYVFNKSGNKPYLTGVLVMIGVIGLGIGGYHYEKGFKARIDKTVMVFSGNYEAINKASSLRLPVWETAFRMVYNKPLNGVGVKGFHGSYPLYAAPNDPFKTNGANHPHLFLLEILAETGVVGLLAMLFATGLIFKLGIENLKKWSPLQAGGAVTVAIAFFPLNAHVSFYGSIYSQVAWLMTAISLAWIHNSDRSAVFNK